MNASEEQRLVEAIRRAEQGHRGEVLVHLERRCEGGDALARAARLFDSLGLRRTAADTGVLLYVALEDRKTAVFAGRGVHGAAEPGFWKAVVDTVADGFRRQDAVGGLVAGVERIGGLLLTAVPGEDVAGNELPDRVSQA